MVYTEIKYPKLVNDKGSLTEVEKQILGNFIVLSGGKVLLELGLYKAVTTKFICHFLEINKIEGKLYAFDIPDVVESVSNDPEIKDFINKGILELVPGWLPHSLSNWIKNHPGVPIDFVLDDALHDYPSVYGELKLIWPRLAKSGFILCHDYAGKFPGVVYAVNKFASRHNACMVPMLSSPKTQAAGMGSVLVALRKREFPGKLSSMISNEYYLWRLLLAKTWLWKKVLRPMVR